jgi:hypothetical protein
VVAERRSFPAERAEKWEDMFIDNLEHLPCFERFETRPTQIFIRPGALIFAVLSFRKEASLHRDFELRGLPLFDGMQLVEAFNEKQICQLLNH